MSLLRVVETYASYQGEGPNTSRPTVFVRFAGCNFKCPGWPCDTQHAIQPKLFRHTQRFVHPEQLANEVLDFGIANICLTGGEVFLQDQNSLSAFVMHLRNVRPLTTVEVFTNGALKWDDDLVCKFDNIILDWKLFGSGEQYDPTPTFEENFRQLNQCDAVKFTIKDEVDYIEAKRRYNEHIKPIDRLNRPMVYAGVVWENKWTTEELCEHMIRDQLPWNLNVQVHKYVWHPDKQGV